MNQSKSMHQNIVHSILRQNSFQSGEPNKSNELLDFTKFFEKQHNIVIRYFSFKITVKMFELFLLRLLKL